MSNNASLQSCMNKIITFCEERDWDQFHNAKDLAIGISTEAGNYWIYSGLKHLMI